MYIYIKDGKIFDVCSNLENKRDNSIPDKDYLGLPMNDWVIGDTWDFENDISLKESPIRFEPRAKTEFEILKEQVENLKLKIELLEKN